MIEIEPIAAQVTTRAWRTLVAAALAAPLLLIAASIAFRWLAVREREAAARSRERDLASLGEMSAVLAHEIKNPLASLKGNAQLLAEAQPDDARLARVVTEAVRLETLVHDLLAFVRTGEIARRPGSPVAIVRAAADEIAGEYIQIDGTAAPERWSLDPARLRQALVNLLRNGVEAGPPVAVRVDTERGALRIEVRDHGPGLAPGSEVEVFAPFHTTKVHGTGLGLAVARRIVELHGGSIAAYNHPEGGAVFTVSIPA